METLYDPRHAPIRGVNTTQHPMSLPPGVLSASNNLRFKDGAIECRGGMSASKATILASGQYRGHWEGTLWGAKCILIALYDGSSKTLIYRSTDLTTWTELTAAAGAFGNTRLSGNAPVSFAVVSDPFSLPTATNTERLMFTDGTGATRVCATTRLSNGLSGPITDTLSDIAPPTVGDATVSVLTIETYLRSANASVFTSTVGDFEGTVVGADPDKVQRFTIYTTIDPGDTVTFAYSSHIAVGGGQLKNRQILIGVDTAYTMLWDKVKVTMGSQVLWDPSNSSLYSRPIPVPFDSSQKMIWVFDHPATLSGSLTGNFVFEWVAPATEAPATNTTFDVFLMAITFGTTGYADWSFATTYAQTFTNAESPGVIYNNYETQRLSDFGAPPLNGARLPRSPILQAQFACKTKNPASTPLAAGVDSARFYYQEPGSQRFKYVRRERLADWSGSAWTLSTGSSGDVLSVTGGVDSDFYSLPEVYLPDAYNVTVPTSKCIAWVNDRLFAAGAVGANSSVFVSEYRNAFRMRRFTAYQNGEVEPDAPITMGVGAALVQKIVPLSSSILGSDSVFVFTDSGILVTGGSTSGQLQRLSRVSKFGTLSPNSITELNGSLFYLDTEMQVRVLSGGQPQSITRGVVDNVLHEIPAGRRPLVSACVHRERYYLAYTPSGGSSNTRILVWDDVTRMWCFDTPKIAAEGLVSWLDGTNNAKRLILVGSDGKAYEYDLSTEDDDDGTSIPCSMSFWELHQPDGKNFSVNQIGITADDVSGGSGTVTRLYKPNAATATSSINLDATGNQIVRYDGTQTGASKGVACLLSIAMNLTAGKKILKIVALLEPRDHAYDATS